MCAYRLAKSLIGSGQGSNAWIIYVILDPIGGGVIKIGEFSLVLPSLYIFWLLTCVIIIHA